MLNKIRHIRHLHERRDRTANLQQALLNTGVPVNLAQLAARVLAKDGCHWTDKDMAIVRSVAIQILIKTIGFYWIEND